MLGIWRFYKDGEAGWKWQRLSINKVVMAESPQPFAEYDNCVQDAIRQGYQHQPSQEKIRPRFGAHSYNRPYVPPRTDLIPPAVLQAAEEKRAGS